MPFPQTLTELEKDLKGELKLLNYPPANWLKSSHPSDCAVTIVGAGMAGLTAAFELIRMGVSDLMIFDSRPAGFEGPWRTQARMRFLRSGKAIPGPAFHVPLLTFQAWYQAQFGFEAWEQLYKIPTHQWMDYLNWFRKVLDLPVNNETTLLKIRPQGQFLELQIDHRGTLKTVKTQKVVLATGREGFGGLSFPQFVNDLPHECYAHTQEPIDFTALRNKRIGIVGVGASAFDAAAEALEKGASIVQLLTRRTAIPNINKTASLSYPGCSEGYYYLSDEARLSICEYVFSKGSPPPFESLDRIKGYPNVTVNTHTAIQSAEFNQGEIHLHTPKGALIFDFLILATGFAIEGSQQPELADFFDQILLWSDRPCAHKAGHSKVGAFPYLGPSFEFLEKKPGQAPHLSQIYCYNYAATASHWHLSSDIPDISFGAQRLAQGIARDFFDRNWKAYYNALQEFHKHEFLTQDYPFIK